MHTNGIFHRDLKFENILLSEGFDLKIADFGYSIHASELVGLTSTQWVGTELYMSPELYAGRAYVPASADIFAAGFILFTIYSGKPPYNRAIRSDYFYGMIMNGNLEEFWTISTGTKP